MWFQKKCAAHIEKTYYGYPQAREYITGTEKKMQVIFADMKKNSSFFERQVMLDDETAEQPKLTMESGNFGFVPGQNIPVTMSIRYSINPSKPVKPSSELAKTVKIFLWSLIFLGSLIGVGQIFLTAKISEGLEYMHEVDGKCQVITKDGKPVALHMYGEQIFYSPEGDIILPKIREVLPHEHLAYNKPFEHCDIVATDGIPPA